MAEIIINEFSSDYSYNIGSTTFCSVALPIAASWGPAFEDPSATGTSLDQQLEKTKFTHFASNQAGMEAFLATYRGPASGWRSAQDYSYYYALSLLSAGYDVDVCRLCPGTHAQASFTTEAEAPAEAKTFTVKAKYPGSFGNCLKVVLTKLTNPTRWNLITYVVDANGSTTAVENIYFVFNVDSSTDSLLHISEVESNFLTFVYTGLTDSDAFTATTVTLANGSDRAADGTAAAMMTSATALATARFALVADVEGTAYLAALTSAASSADVATASSIRYREWLFRYACEVFHILTDRLSYKTNRIVSPGWDDLDIKYLTGSNFELVDQTLSPMHAIMMQTAYLSRCATAFLDIPRSIDRSNVDGGRSTYTDIISQYNPTTDGLFSTHSALFAPWGQFVYTGTSKQNIAPPSLFALLIQRGMLANQALQYEWAMPTTRKHSVSIGKLDYNVPKNLLDQWQSSEGVSVNVIADIPDLGVCIWGNSTCYDVPPATYNALQNLSSRFLMNAVKDVAFRCGLAITFQYNNDEAYSKFYAGCTPLLDTMRNVGAITRYEISMAADINGLDSVNANSVIGKITLYVAGVINNITIDLVALPSV